MPHVPHQTTPFRRPSSSWPQELQPDPAEVGTAFGLELCLASESGDSAEATAARHEKKATNGDSGQGNAPGALILCP